MQFSHSFMQQLHAVLLCVVSFREDCQARKLNKEDAMDRSKWRKLIKDVRCSGWVWVGECFFWYRPTRVVPDQRPLNGWVCVCCFFSSLAAITLPPVGKQSIAVSMAVCYLSVHFHFSETPCSDFTKFPVISGCGSVLLWQCWGELHTSGFVVVVFTRDWLGRGDASSAFTQSDSPGAAPDQGQSLCLSNTGFIVCLRNPWKCLNLE